jgi:uncharacterized membrane protein YcaP (DUF421 family)
MAGFMGIVLRAAITYAYLLSIVRVGGKRTIGEGTSFDFIVALVVGDIPDDIIWGEVPLLQGFVAMGTVMCLHWAVSYFAYRSPRFDRIVGSAPARVIARGRLLSSAQLRERLSDEDIQALARLEGIEHLGEIEAGRIEQSGRFSVLKTEGSQPIRRADLNGAPGISR